MADALREAVLAVLAGATSHAPLRVWQIAGRLPGPLPTEAKIRAALDDLVARRAVNTARTSPDAVRFEDVYWPTGALPAAVPWRDLSINGHTAADARAAREAAELAARKATQATQATQTTQAEKEPGMDNAHTAPSTARRMFGDVQREALALLDPLTEPQALDAPAIHARLTLPASIGSTRKTLQRLAKLGLIASRVDGVGINRRAYFWGLQGDLLHLSPRHRPRASKPVEKPEAAPPASRLEANGWRDATEDAEPPMVSETRAPLADLHDDMRFGVYDDGSLEIWRGGHLVLCLSPGQATRLYALLQATMPGLAESHPARLGGQEDA